MSYNYGLSTKDLQDCKDKLAKQKDYLTSQSFLDEKTGEIRSLLDYSYSANLSTRYYPRIMNKVHTFVSLNTSRNYVPIFLTVTLDGFFRDFLKGDFSRWEQNRESYLKHIPNNDRSGKYLDHIDENKTITNKDLYKIIGHQLHRFTKAHSFKCMKKDGFSHSYIRVTEPHQDGVPHFHILLYIPEQYIESVYKDFKRFFPAPQNHKPLSDRKGVELFTGQHETKGFQIEINSAGGYILKYILKSFRNLIEEKELDYMQAWYVHNKIPRIITTHTLVSQDIYHHAALLEEDWFYLTTIKLNDYFHKDSMMNTFHFKSRTNREIIFNNGHYQLINDGSVVQEFGENKIFGYKFTVDCPIKYPFVPNIPTSLIDKFWLFRRKKKYVYSIEDLDPFIEIQFEDNETTLIMTLDTRTMETNFKHDLLPVNQLSYIELYYLYENFDFEKDNPAKFGLVKNRLIEIGLLDEDLVNLNDYNFNFVEKEIYEKD